MIDDAIPVASIGEVEPKPGYLDTLQAAVARPFYQLHGMVDDLLPQIGFPEERKQIADKLDMMNQKLGDPRIGMTQGVADYVAELGSSIAATAPLAAIGGVAAGSVTEALGVASESLLPEGAINFLDKPLNKIVTGEAADYIPGLKIPTVAKGIAESYGAYKGMIIPEHVVENYHKENDTLNSQQALEDWSKDNWGFAIPAIPLVPGYLLFKVLKVHGDAKFKGDYAKALVSQHEEVRTSRQKILSEALQRAQTGEKVQRARSNLEKEFDTALEEKRITPYEHAYMMAYLENPNDQQNLIKKGMPILQEAQIPMDRATGRIWHEIVSKNSMKNLKQAITDRMGSDLSPEDQSNMVDYVSNNSFDAANAMVANHPELMSALKGFSVFANQKLLARKDVTKAAKKMLKENIFVENPDIFDKEKFPYLRLEEINKDKLDTMKQLYEVKEKSYRFNNALQEYVKLLKSVQEKYPDIEQELEYLKGNMLSQENIYKHLSENNLPTKNSPYTVPNIVKEKLSIIKKIKKSNDLEEIKRLGFRLKQLEFEKIPQEIERLTEELENNLKSNYKQSDQYKRLQDLANYRDDAKQALAYLDMQHEYNRQESMLKSLNSFVDMVDSTVAKFADPNKVIDYLNKRIEQNIPRSKSMLKEFVEKPKIAETEKAKIELKIDKERIKEVDAEHLLKEFDLHQLKHEQFAENIKTLEDLVDCTLEKINA